MSKRRRLTLVTLAVVSLLLAALIASLLLTGALFGEDPRRYGRLLLVALVVGALVCVLLRYEVGLNTDSALNSQTTALTAIALVAGLWGFSGLVFSASPSTAAAPQCDGAPPGGGGQDVQTRLGGVNVRLEPSIIGTQVGRLGGECTITVDGFCLGGTPLHDAAAPQHVDVRWFRLHRNRGWNEPFARLLSGGTDSERYVAAATITSFVSQDLVPQLSDEECATAGTPVPVPGEPVLSAGRSDGQQAVFNLTAPNTFEFGVSLLILGETTTGNPYRKITTWERPNDVKFKATWTPAATASYLMGTTDVVIFGGRCFAIGAPMDPVAESATLAYRLEPEGSIEPLSTTPELSQEQLDALADMACREDGP